MKKIFIVSLLFLGICNISVASPSLEMGNFEYKRENSEKFEKKPGLFLSGDFFSPTSMGESTTHGYIRNPERLFYVDDKGYVVVGNDIPKGITSQSEKGDLIVTGNLWVMGDIWNPPTSQNQELKILKEEVRLLKQKIEALENR